MGLSRPEHVLGRGPARPTPGVSPSEIAEVLQHVSVYAGLPVANSAFRLAKEILSELTDVEDDAERSTEESGT